MMKNSRDRRMMNSDEDEEQQKKPTDDKQWGSKRAETDK